MAHKNRSNWSPYKERRAKALGAKARADKSAHGKAPVTSASSPSTSPSPAHHSPGSRHRRPEETFNFHEADDRMYSIFRNHGFGDYPHDKRQKLTRFYQLLMENQKHENFTRLLSLRDVAIKHFIDSLIVTRLTDLDFPLLDMGTGPGFPGIPLKIHFPEKRVILAEGVQRRVNFLKKVRDELALPNLDIIGRNINEQFLYPVQSVVTRAVEDSRNTLGNVLYCLQTGGRVFLMKGPNVDPEIEPALKAWGEYYQLEKNIAYELPQTPHQRRLLVFRKIKPAPLRDLDADLDEDFARNAADQDENDDE
jgi:16S rRNA (guanine527-N7)-methyltransferase